MNKKGGDMEDKQAYLKEFYTLEQLANDINMTVQSLRKFIKAGDLQAYKVGNRYMVTREDIKAWLEHNKVKN